MNELKKAMKIADINKELKEILADVHAFSPTKIEAFKVKYEKDPRKGVQKLINKGMDFVEAYEKEVQRVHTMLSYERKVEECGYVGGVDEAGRGPLAGPVVAACVILKKDDPIFYVNDSKKLSEAKREQLYEEIIQRSLSYGIGIVSEKDIDQMNILQATYKAMKIALEQMATTPNILLNDAVIIPGVDLLQLKIIKGDTKSLSIAAASILAKVTRDRIMVAYDELYPEYGFAKHKGYGAPKHIDAIKTYGPCPIHRQSFIKNFVE